MRYVGSKRRIIKDILPIILKGRKSETFYDFFCGGGNVCENVGGRVVAVDAHYYLICALDLIKTDPDFIPRRFTERDYYAVKNHKDKFPPGIVGYVGFALSYGGRWFSSWNRDNKGKRDFATESWKLAQKQSPKLKNVSFVCSDYKGVQVEPGSIVYCDPPYHGVSGYGFEFNHREFWRWCRSLKENGCKVYVSEYSAPTDVTCVWAKAIPSGVCNDTGSKIGIERLFFV